MYINTRQLLQMDSRKRANLLNCIGGIKPGNLIGTVNNRGAENLAIFNSVVHLGANPSLVGFILRPDSEVRRHTYENILETNVFTINHIHNSITHKAHLTSAKWPEHISEFTKVNLTPEYLEKIKAPFVKESKVKFALIYKETIDIKLNGTKLIIGGITDLFLPEENISEEGLINLEETESIGVGGLNDYYDITKIANYPYARAND